MPGREMPAFTKSPPELVERFRSVLDRHPEAERKQMFGYPAAFIGGNLATGLFADRWMVRVGELGMDEALAAGAEPFSPMPGRAMKGFVAIPPDAVGRDEAIDGWVGRGLATAAALPAKTPKAKATKTG